MSDDEKPLSYAFGRAVKFLSPAEAAGACANERIASVWPFVGEKVRAFTATLTTRELANFDEEDAMLECWIAIRERDRAYDPRIGPYVSFAAPIIRNCLYRVREEARTVVSAKNATYRIRKAEQRSADGKLTRRCEETLKAIVASTSSPATIDANNQEKAEWYGLSVPASSVAEDREEFDLSIDAIIEGILCLSPYEAMIVGRSAGLWGNHPRSISEIAREEDRSDASVRAIRRKALAAIRRYLEIRGHPVSKPGWME